MLQVTSWPAHNCWVPIVLTMIVHELVRGDSLCGEAEVACAAGPLAQVEMVCSVWGTTDSRRRTLLSSTASCGSTVSRQGPVAAKAAFQRHLFGDDLHNPHPTHTLSKPRAMDAIRRHLCTERANRIESCG